MRLWDPRCYHEWMRKFIMYCCTSKALYNHISGSLLNHHQCALSTWMMRRQPQNNGSIHTSYRWRGERERERVMEPIQLTDEGQWRECGQDTGVTPLLFTRSVLGFLMTTESQDLNLMFYPKAWACYSIVSPSLYWGFRTHTDHKVSTPCWPQ